MMPLPDYGKHGAIAANRGVPDWSPSLRESVPLEIRIDAGTSEIVMPLVDMKNEQGHAYRNRYVVGGCFVASLDYEQAMVATAVSRFRR